MQIALELGNSFCKVGAYNNSHKIEIIPNDQGSRTTPTVVAFTETDEIVGIIAKSQMFRNYENTAVNVLNPSHDENFPMKVIGNKSKSKSDILMLILKKLKTQAGAFFNSTNVTGATITIPPNFSDKESLLKAAEQVGLKDLTFIPSPIAIAMSYGLDELQTTEEVLIFDLGGTYLNVSTMTVASGLFSNLETKTFPIGGKDFDNVLINHCVNEFKQKTKSDCTESKKAMAKLALECEIAKITLSTVAKANMEIDSLFDGHDYFSSITRARFDMITNSVIFKILGFLEEYKEKKFTKIVLAGGSSAIPRVQEQIANFFEVEVMKGSYLEECGVTGCTIHINSKREGEPLSEVPITSNNFYILNQANEKIKLFAKNTVLPVVAELSIKGGNGVLIIYQEDDLIYKNKVESEKVVVVLDETGKIEVK
jgi:heat shock protein 1/8